MKTKRVSRVASLAEIEALGGVERARELGVIPQIAGAAILPQVGSYPLLGVGQLPNASQAFPGEVWTNKRANGVIIPGSCVTPVKVGDVGCVKPVGADDTIDVPDQLAVALHQIMVPDTNPGSIYNPVLGPNELVSLPIADMDYVRYVMTGVLHLTLVVPDATYEEGDLIGWDPGGVRPAGKAAGTGAWAKADAIHDGTDIFVVHEPPRYYGTANEALLTCRFRRSNQ